MILWNAEGLKPIGYLVWPLRSLKVRNPFLTLTWPGDLTFGDLGLKFIHEVSNSIVSRYWKNVGAARHRFPAIREKPEGWAFLPPPPPPVRVLKGGLANGLESWYLTSTGKNPCRRPWSLFLTLWFHIYYSVFICLALVVEVQNWCWCCARQSVFSVLLTTAIRCVLAAVPCVRGVTQLPNPYNCRGYFSCPNGTLQDGFCADGYLFDPAIGHCRYADEVRWENNPVLVSCRRGQPMTPRVYCQTCRFLSILDVHYHGMTWCYCLAGITVCLPHSSPSLTTALLALYMHVYVC